MVEPQDEPGRADPAPSPGTQAFRARRAAMDEAAAADAVLAAARRVRAPAGEHAESYNPMALLAGIAVLALLLGGFIFVLDRFRSDPWFSDCPTAETGGCR